MPSMALISCGVTPCSSWERYADADWVISDLVRMECLVGPLRSADQI